MNDMYLKCLKTFGLTYCDKDNLNNMPLCIHRSPLGTHERLIRFLTPTVKRFCGRLPR